MQLTRRSAIKRFAIIAGGLALVPSCMMEEKENESISPRLKNFQLDTNQWDMVAGLSEAIIPTTDTPGAREIHAHIFVIRMVDDCLEKQDRQKFIKGLAAFDSRANELFEKTFIQCSPVEKEQYLRDIENGKEKSETVRFFYTQVKNLTIQSFITSEFFMTEVEVYSLTPGIYNPCVPVKSSI